MQSPVRKLPKRRAIQISSQKFFHVLVEVSVIHACTFTTARETRYGLKVNPL